MSAPSLSEASELVPPAADAAGRLAALPGRATWSGLLRLSLVAVPVKAFPATVSGPDTHFHQLHAGCGRRIRHVKHCPAHGPVEAGAIVPGYPVGPDRCVVVDPAALEKLRPAKDQALTLEHFLEAGQIDPALFAGRSLYLVPDGPAAQHPYAVLAQALRQRRQWGLGRLVLSGRRQLALVRPAGRLLVLHLLHYPAQFRSGAALEAQLRDSPASPTEQQLAGMLLDSASQPIDWAAYRDDTAEQLHALIEALLQGQALAALAAEEAPVPSLLEALRQSVAAARGATSPGPASAPSPPAKNKHSRRSP